MTDNQGLEKTWSHEEISEGGERVSHLKQDHVFFGHLSIYDFAVPLCREGVVLDAGSGAGYGAAHLADSGARQVYGIDVSAKSVHFSKEHFKRANLEYREMSLEQITGFPDHSFDFIYTSNTLEHVPKAFHFFHNAWRLLKKGGMLLVAVPPITNGRLKYLNYLNSYHVHIWTPRQWAYALGFYFREVVPFLHGVERIGADYTPEHIESDNSGLTEKSFVFQRGTLKDMYKMFTLTAIFLAKKLRSPRELPAKDSPIPLIDDSFTRQAGLIDQNVLKRLEKECDNVSAANCNGSSLDSVLIRRSSLSKVALDVWKTQGTLALSKRTFSYFKKKCYRKVKIK